jgi:hypothetical protein
MCTAPPLAVDRLIGLADVFCLSRKKDYEDVLDPFEIEDGWFYLEFVSGRIYPNPNLDNAQQHAVQVTIDRLRLDDARNREMRARYYHEYYTVSFPAEYLKKKSPFVYFEAERQGLL